MRSIMLVPMSGSGRNDRKVDPVGFFDSSSRSAAFEQPGASVTGKVVAWKEIQATDFTTNEPKFWQDGTPQMKVIVDLQTEQRDDENDDGVRALHVSGKHSKRALLDALKRGGSKTPDEGGTLTMTYTGDDPQSKNPRQPAKMYSAAWAKPERASQTFGTGQPAAQQAQAKVQTPGGSPAGTYAASAVQQPPAQQPAAQADPWAPAVSQGDAEKVRALVALGMGMSDAQIAAAVGISEQAVTSVRNDAEPVY